MVIRRPRGRAVRALPRRPPATRTRARVPARALAESAEPAIRAGLLLVVASASDSGRWGRAWCIHGPGAQRAATLRRRSGPISMRILTSFSKVHRRWGRLPGLDTISAAAEKALRQRRFRGQLGPMAGWAALAGALLATMVMWPA
jgi:hypothetical protein